MKEKLLDIFNSKNYQPKTFEEITEILELSTPEEYEKLRNELDFLLDDYQIFLNKKKTRYILPKDANIYKGRIEIAKQGYGFIISDYYDKDLFVAISNLESATNKDEVLFTTHMFKGRGKTEAKLEGKVIKILSRHLLYVIGEVKINKNKYYINSPDVDKRVKIDNPEGLKEGMVVKGKINKYLPDIYYVDVIDILGNKDDVGMDIAMIAAKYDFPTEFKKETIEEANNYSDDISKEVIRRKKIYRNIITIDGDDAKDLDDAISVEKLENGNYLLGVYIADVSFYVTKDSFLDQEAYERGTSVYLTDRVIPMLPKRLSNNLCSLNPNEDKLVIGCDMEINDQGKVLSTYIYEASIKTKYRMTYNNVNKILDGEKELIEKYKDIYDDILLMNDLALVLEKMRHDRGALDFDIPEGKVIVDENGKPVDVVLRERGTSEKIIESFMLAANESVATTITHLDLPFIYRVHDLPNSQKLESFQSVAKTLGYSLKNKGSRINQTTLQSVLERISEEDSVLNTLLLRMMAKAIYSEKNIGHYGIASECYTHFTSPIRRYPDLLVHRLIRKYIFDAKINSSEFPELTAYIRDVAEHSSVKERDAIECEYEVDDMKKAEYMEQFLGEEFEGTISSITNFGIFVELPNTVEGLVRLKEIDGESFEYDSKLMLLRGHKSNKVFKIGDKVKVVLIKSSKKAREIDFKLVYNMNNGKEKKKVEIKRESSSKPRKKRMRESYGKQKLNRKKQKGKS